MKSLLLFSFIGFAVAVTGCSKKVFSSSSSADTYTGVVVVNACGNIAIETVGPRSLGEDNWTPDGGSRTYNHVFGVQNGCQFGSHAVGDTIKFVVVNAEEQSCAQCMMFVPVPATKYPVRVVR